ncbi:hypothetical protein [Bacillus thuringiensis]|uniref:hypothetical protein n=1 Tax=Bacillus thuringiensis TaxID=1428 RepID=UPI003A87E23E
MGEDINNNTQLRQPGYIEKVIPIGPEFFLPEFKIAQCNTNRKYEHNPNYNRWGISMNTINKEFKNAESAVKTAAKKLNDEINKLLGDNSAEIKKIDKELKEYVVFLTASLDCATFDLSSSLPTCLEGIDIDPFVSKCNTQYAQNIIQRIKELQKKCRKLRSRKGWLDSYVGSIQNFQKDIGIMTHVYYPIFHNINFPKGWPTLEGMQYLPVLVKDYLNFPKTLKDMKIDPSLIQSITLPTNIKNMVKIPESLYLDLETLKDHIQFDEQIYPVQRVLTSIANKAIDELQQYNMCFFIKNSPYFMTIKLRYISDFKKLVESYIFGCLEKAKDAALTVFIGYVPSIINTYGSTIPVAISNAFATYWSTFKKCLLDVYTTFKKDIQKLTNTTSFEDFLKAMEKYISIDFTIDKRTVPWENKGSLVSLVSNRLIHRETVDLPFLINTNEEYIQSEPQFSLPIKDYTLDEESISKVIHTCGRYGMWVYLTFKDLNYYWLNMKNFENNTLSGYRIIRTSDGMKNIKHVSIPVQYIKNIQCYNSVADSIDNYKDLFSKYYVYDFCSSDKGVFFGKSFIDLRKGLVIYYEVYECGVLTRIYFDKSIKSELYIPRYKKVDHKLNIFISPTKSYNIGLDITKKQSELQKRLRIIINEKVLDENISPMIWVIKLPWN